MVKTKILRRQERRAKLLERNQTKTDVTHRPQPQLGSNKSVSQVHLEDKSLGRVKCDTSNPLIHVPGASSGSKHSVSKKKTANIPKISKKQQKKLQKILDRKRKKQDRSVLISELQKYRLGTEEIRLLKSTTSLQTKGSKRAFEPSKYESSKHLAVEADKHELESSSESSSDSEADDDDAQETPGPSPPASKDINSSQKSPEPVHPVEKQLKPVPMLNKTIHTRPPAAATMCVEVLRSEEMQKVREKLPIVPEESAIMEKISAHDVVTICGETGSGKTTQLPQFLYEAGYALDGRMIGVTEPRRVAAMSMSQRVAIELGLTGAEVSYQIRFEGNTTKDTKIKFMTDGVLLKEIQKDFLLINYSAIIVDEAHERSINSDILIGLLSRIVPLRRKKAMPLKLIIMSATLRVEDFTKNAHLFPSPPPIVKIDSRQYPVTVHFNKHTPDDYMSEAFRKAVKIHTTSKDKGGILIFVTGQREVNYLVKRLSKAFPLVVGNHQDRETPSASRCSNSAKEKENCGSFPATRRTKRNKIVSDIMPKISLDDFSLKEPHEEDALREGSDAELSDLDSDSDAEDQTTGGHEMHDPLYCLPMYSMLPPERQRKVFDRSNSVGVRLCVVATNVAETSLTIPNVKYVIDTGRVKERVYDRVTGVSAFRVTWVSKASANQRAGRAGRMGAGHVYRLYSSAIFNNEFQDFTPAEILSKPIEDLVLQMKAMNIENVINFPFPSSPSREAIIAAERKLVVLEALEESPLTIKEHIESKSKRKSFPTCTITALGRVMSHFPVGARYAKMIVLSHQHGLLSYAVSLVSGLTVGHIFSDEAPSEEYNDDDLVRLKKMKALRTSWAPPGEARELGDFMVWLKAIGASQFSGCTQQFCDRYGLRYRSLMEIHKLRSQLIRQINGIIPSLEGPLTMELEPVTDMQCRLLRQLLTACFGDHVARKISESEMNQFKTDEGDRNHTKRLKLAYISIEVEEPVFIHANSVHSQTSSLHLPEYVIYHEMWDNGKGKMILRGLASIQPEWLPVLVGKSCTFDTPLTDPPPSYQPQSDTIKCWRNSSFSPRMWPMPATQLSHPTGLDCARWFACFLLRGDINSPGRKIFRKYCSSLLSSPETTTKTWWKLHKRTIPLVETLYYESVYTGRSLASKWATNANFLLAEYLQWIPASLHNEIRMCWPGKSEISAS